MKHYYVILIFFVFSKALLAESYENVGKKLNIDPLLLHSFAIHESRENPWALNINGESCHKDSHPFVVLGKLTYCDSQSSAIKILKHVSKNPWLLKGKLNNKTYRFWFKSERAARNFKWRHQNRLTRVRITKKKTSSTDIGLMQINWRYHYDKVGNIYNLLDPSYNLNYGAQYYAKLSKRYSSVVAIGKYHNKNNLKRQVNYRNKILKIYRRLQEKI